MKRTRRGWNSTVAPGKPPQRKTRPKRKGKPRFKGRKDEAFREWLRGLPCCVTGKRSGERKELLGPGIPVWSVYHVEAAHVRSRGAGGDDRGNLVPLDWLLHREQHRIGIKSFEKKHGIDLRDTAQHLLGRYLRETGEAA